MLELYLIRHGQSTSNQEERIQGQQDVPLSDEGIRQSQRLTRRLRGMHFDAVYCSDLQRAKQTALCAYAESELILDARLREIHLGIFQGRLWQDLNAEERQQLSVFHSGPYNVKVPGGESNDDLQARALSWLSCLPSQGRVIAFTHGGFIRSILQSIIGRPTTQGWGFRIENTSITELRLSDHYKTIYRVSDVAHLETL